MPEIWNKYGPTAARSHNQSKSDSRRPQSGTLDIHSHVMVPAAAECRVQPCWPSPAALFETPTPPQAYRKCPFPAFQMGAFKFRHKLALVITPQNVWPIYCSLKRRVVL